MTLKDLKDRQREAFLALAPFATEEDAYFDANPPMDVFACASHDAIGCPLCGWTM